MEIRADDTFRKFNFNIEAFLIIPSVDCFRIQANVENLISFFTIFLLIIFGYEQRNIDE